MKTLKALALLAIAAASLVVASLEYQQHVTISEERAYEQRLSNYRLIKRHLGRAEATKYARNWRNYE